jgi:hypothetical protein
MTINPNNYYTKPVHNSGNWYYPTSFEEQQQTGHVLRPITEADWTLELVKRLRTAQQEQPKSRIRFTPVDLERVIKALNLTIGAEAIRQARAAGETNILSLLKTVRQAVPECSLVEGKRILDATRPAEILELARQRANH